MDKIKIFYDGLDFKQDKLIQGYTLNPTLLKKINKPFEESIKIKITISKLSLFLLK